MSERVINQLNVYTILEVWIVTKKESSHLRLMKIVFVHRNDEALKYVIDVKTGRTLHETEIKTFPEDIDENVQNGRHHEAVENHQSENEDPNHPFHKGSIQTVDSYSKNVTSLKIYYIYTQSPLSGSSLTGLLVIRTTGSPDN